MFRSGIAYAKVKHGIVSLCQGNVMLGNGKALFC